MPTRLYSSLDSECYFGRHDFINGECSRAGCAARQSNVISIDARRWFQRAYGNTYHSVTVTMPDGIVLRCPFAYGYARQYEDTALALIRDHFKDAKEEGQRLNPYLSVKGFYAAITVSDVGRKKDL